MQIVNGGQTTASIFNAKNDRKIAADLCQVFVQMKISVIHSADDMDEIVPRISTFANTQNKIQVADFSANDPFHRRIEELSRTIWAPAQGGMKPRICGRKGKNRRAYFSLNGRREVFEDAC